MALVARGNVHNFGPEPESPPELTSSKSSKTSSFRSSGSSGEGVSPHNSSDFESIALDDSHGAATHETYDAYASGGELGGHASDKENSRYRHGSMQLPRMRPSASSASSGRSSSTITGPMRDLTSAQRPALQTKPVNGAIVGNGRGPQTALHIPSTNGMRRGFTSPTSPRFSAPPLGPHSQRSRSPSPTFLQSFGLSHKVPRRSSSRSSLHSNPSLAPIARRSSWQPGRKSVKELEDEYHDSDEDIPEDAIVWNVPLSPRPGNSRSVLQAWNDKSIPPTPTTAPLHQNITFPDPQPQSGSIHALRKQRSTPAIREDSEYANLRLRPSPRNSRRPSPLQSVTDLTDGHLYAKSRAKSYSEAMEDLSTEARHITAALEAYETQRTQSSDTARSPTPETNPSSAANAQIARSSTTPISPGATSPVNKAASGKTIVTLPPVRKGDVMIDPLPISKEKEKVLTRTRPSWLPPKDQKEEKKHLKEYRRMMEASFEAEKKRVAREAAEQSARDAAAASVLKIWESYVLPEWSSAIAEPRTRELWWRGVPEQHRGEVWLRAAGNDLHLTETSYTTALRRAQEERSRIEKLVQGLGDGESLKDEEAETWNWLERLESDIATISQDSEWAMYSPSGPGLDLLRSVLMAYASYRSDVGYVSGLHRLAALLLLYMPSAANAFIVMANFLNRPVPMAYLLTTLRFRSSDCADPDSDDADAEDAATADRDVPAAISSTHILTLKTLKYKLPSLHAHLTSPALGLRPADYLDPLLSAFFVDARVGVERASRAWDIMLFEGDKVLVRAAVAALTRLENRLYGDAREILSVLGWHADAPALADSLGDVEEWVGAMREAGKVDKRPM